MSQTKLHFIVIVFVLFQHETLIIFYLKINFSVSFIIKRIIFGIYPIFIRQSVHALISTLIATYLHKYHRMFFETFL